MKVALLDQGGPLWVRALPYPVVMGALTLASGVATAALSGGWAIAAFLAFLYSAPLAGLVPTAQRRWREADLVVGPGLVELRGAGLRNQRIRAKSVIGASTAEIANGILLTLMLKSRRSPVQIELGSEAECEEVRRALGIGHAGFGAIGWYPQRTATTNSALFGRVAWVLGPFLMVAGSLLFLGGAIVPLFALFGMLVGFVLSSVGWLSFSALPAPPITMEARGLTLSTKKGWRSVPYGHLRDVIVEHQNIVFVVTPGDRIPVARSRLCWGGEGLSDAAAEALVAQVKSAAARARGLGRHKDDRASQLESLRRRGEAPRDWLLRLDALGRTLAAGGGYRGTSLDANDLWSVLEDPDADLELRSAAGRVLRSSGLPDAKVRIDAAVAATHDEGAEKRLRIATDDDVDRASRELDDLEAQHLKDARVRMRAI